MTEIPEHLLARSKARRQAIGQDEGGDAPAGDAPAASAAVEKAAPAAAPAGPAPAGGLAPAKAPASPSLPPAPPKRPEVVAAETRKKIPSWAVPAVVALPVWAFLYAFTLDPPTQASAALSAGEDVYSSAGCAGCHGAGGVGTEGVFPGFDGQSVILTFPDYEDHVAWVQTGSDGANPDGTYGDPERPEGPHSIAQFSGDMPGFEGSLSEEEILEVVRYEREVLAGYGCEPALAEATGEQCTPGTEAEGAEAAEG